MNDIEFILREYVSKRLYECSKYFDEHGNLEGAKEIKERADRLSNK
jgi:hypothetical protein